MRYSIVLLLLLFSCGKNDKNTLKIAATPVPHAQMLRFIEPSMKEQGITLEIFEVNDYMIPNRALQEKEVDANFFQHIPFMDEQIKEFGYQIQCYARIHLEPMAIYSKKIDSLDNLPRGAKISLPNDPTNEYRALSILVDKGLISLKPGVKLEATKVDIDKNPKNLQFIEMDAALLPRTLKDVEAAAIPTNYALEAGLNPEKDSLARESDNSPYTNIIAIRIGDQNETKLEILRKEMLTEKMREFILEKYKGAIIPILKECPKN